MAGDLKKLLQDAGLTQEEIEATEKAFNPKALEAIEQGTMRRADYSRSMDAVKAEERRLQARWDVANAEYQRMLGDYETTQAEKDAALVKLKEAEKKLADAPQIDPAKFLTPEQLEAKLKDQFGQFATSSTAYFGDVLEVADEHRELFGARISPVELMQKASEAKKTPRDYWAETYKVADKRKEVADKRENDKLELVRKEAYDKAVADLAKAPGTGPLAASKSPFYEPQGEAKSPWDDTGPSEAEQKLLGELLQVGR